MKTTTFNEILRSNHMYTFKLVDAARILDKQLKYASLFLSRNKQVKKALRGRYYTQDATEYEVASSILNPSYISLVSALRFYNLTEQMPHIIYVISFKRHRPIENLNGYRVEFVTLKKQMFYGYVKVDGAIVARPEKAIIDMLYINRFTEYAYETIEGGNLNIRLLVKYATMSKNKKIIHLIKTIISKKQKEALI